MQENNNILDEVTGSEYKYGFVTDIETETIGRGLSEDTVRLISAKKEEPEWLLEFRLNAYRHWLSMKEPDWAHLNIPPIDYQDIIYYAAPKKKKGPKSLDEVDPELLKTFDKLGIPLEEQKILSGMAVDAVMDSVSVKTTFKEKLAEKGIIFCSFSEAVKDFPDLVKKYLGTVVSSKDNFFAALNSAVFSDGSFVYIPKGVRCPMELSTYFRINAANTGQFERTLIVADEDSYVSYLEGCTAPQRDENQLHAAIVEIIAETNAEVKYSTVQNWYPGDKEGKGGIYNFVTKRGVCKGDNSKISWTQVETGSAITWKYPSCVLRGDNSIAEFYSVAVTNNFQQADTGTKMIHLGKIPVAVSYRKVYRPVQVRTATEDWSRSPRMRSMLVTIRNATVYCLAITAVLIHTLMRMSKTIRLSSSMKLRHPRSVKSRYSTATKEESVRKRP